MGNYLDVSKSVMFVEIYYEPARTRCERLPVLIRHAKAHNFPKLGIVGIIDILENLFRGDQTRYKAFKALMDSMYERSGDAISTHDFMRLLGCFVHDRVRLDVVHYIVNTCSLEMNLGKDVSTTCRWFSDFSIRITAALILIPHVVGEDKLIPFKALCDTSILMFREQWNRPYRYDLLWELRNHIEPCQEIYARTLLRETIYAHDHRGLVDRIMQNVMQSESDSDVECMSMEEGEESDSDDTVVVEYTPKQKLMGYAPLNKKCKEGSELACTVCSEYTIDITLAGCGHTCCHACLAKWMDIQETCPLCRGVIQDVMKIHIG